MSNYVCVCMCVLCLRVCMSLCACVCMCVYLYINLCLYVCLSLCLSMSLSVCLLSSAQDDDHGPTVAITTTTMIQIRGQGLQGSSRIDHLSSLSILPPINPELNRVTSSNRAPNVSSVKYIQASRLTYFLASLRL